MANKQNESTFELNVVGDESKERWFGKFTVFTKLNHRQQLAKGRIRRELLGEQAQNCSQRELEAAVMLSEIAVSVANGPKWWGEMDSGLLSIDDNLIIKLYEAIEDVRKKEDVEIKKATAEDAKVLKRAVENPEKAAAADDEGEE